MPLYTVLGVDPSLNGTGLVLVSSDLVATHKKIALPSGGDVNAKLERIFSSTEDILIGKSPLLCAIEGPSHGSASRQHTLGQVAGVLRLAAIRKGIPLLTIPPKSMKLAVVGSGSASKEDVADCVNQILRNALPQDTDVTDAAGLALVGLQVANRLCKLSLELPVTRQSLETCIKLIRSKEHKGLKAALRRRINAVS